MQALGMAEKKPETDKMEQKSSEKSWEVLMKVIENREDEKVEVYQDDIDTLLIFTGLFSAVVTAFTIESYQWLKEDPADTSAALLNSTVILLMQIAQQGSQSSSPSPFTNPPPPPPFTATSSVVRINTFWFLSLTIALIDALFGLLCKQWLREHKRQANTQTPGQALALRWLHYRSFEEWHVLKILASLPILLEISLFLFFAGLLELLWTRHQVPFAIVLSVVGLAVLIYGLTTLLPGITIIQQALQICPLFASENMLPLSPRCIDCLPFINLICPYKSPQSWLTFQLLSSLYHLPGCKWVLFSLLQKFNQFWKDYGAERDLDFTFSERILSLSSWSSLDLNVIQKFDRIQDCPDLYELKGLRWLVQGTRDIPSMIPHLKNVLAEQPAYLVMPTVFDDLDPPSESSLDHALNPKNIYNYQKHLFDDNAPAHVTALTSQVLSFHYLLEKIEDWDEYHVNGARKLWDHIKDSKNDKFIQLFFWPEQFLMKEYQNWRAQFLDYLKGQWSQLHDDLQCKIIKRLHHTMLPFLETERENITPLLVANRSSLSFIELLHSNVASTLYRDMLDYSDEWMQILDHVVAIHHLQPHHFQTLSYCFPVGLWGILNNPTASVATLRPFLDSYIQTWNTASDKKRKSLVNQLTTSINTTVLHKQQNPDPALSNRKSEQLLPSHLHLIASKAGLDFLTFINNKFNENSSFSRGCHEDTCQNWVDALESMRVFCRLEHDYFGSIPRYDQTGAIVGHYTPRVNA